MESLKPVIDMLTKAADIVHRSSGLSGSCSDRDEEIAREFVKRALCGAETLELEASDLVILAMSTQAKITAEFLKHLAHPMSWSKKSLRH